jgi:hypothetical protein
MPETLLEYPLRASVGESLPITRRDACLLGYNAVRSLKVIRRSWNMVGACRLHVQGRRIRQATNQNKASRAL